MGKRKKIITTIVILIVVASLTAVLLAYRDQEKALVLRAKVAQAMLVAASAKFLVAEYFLENDAYPNSVSDIDLDHESDDLVSNLRIEDGTIYLEMSPQSGIEGELIFKPEGFATGEFAWDCTASTLPSRHLPKECRTE